MGVPAHDTRDFSFAKKYDLPIVEVIKNPENHNDSPLNEAYTEQGIMINSGEFNGLDNEIRKKKNYGVGTANMMRDTKKFNIGSEIG